MWIFVSPTLARSGESNLLFGNIDVLQRIGRDPVSRLGFQTKRVVSAIGV